MSESLPQDQVAQELGPRIVDVIAKKSAFSNQTHYYVIVDQPVRFVYSRVGPRFNGKHGNFHDFLSGTGRKGEAFAGREFDINLDDGSTFHCQGDVWSCAPPSDFTPVIDCGLSTLEQLSKCYVFSSGWVERTTLEAWLAENEPTDDYYKHDERTQWNRTVRPTLRVIRSAKRRRALRRRGEDVWFEERIHQWVWRMEKTA